MAILNDFIDLLIRIMMWVVLLRFWLQWAFADFYNPLSQSIVKISNPVCRPFRKLFPSHKRYDWGSLGALFSLAILRWVLYFMIVGFQFAQLNIILERSLFMVLNVVMMALFFMLIIRAIASWISSSAYNPVMEVVTQLTEPLLAPIRRVIPPAAGLDFSPMVLLLIIWLIMRILAQL